MNIHVCPLQQPIAPEPIFCPGCHSKHFCKHGVYTRKGFHVRSGIIAIPMAVQRYRCLNKECSRCTFSVLPPMTLRYCRFFWPCLLLFRRTHGKGLPISRGVAERTVTALALMRSWVKDLYREVTDGDRGFSLGRMVKIIVGKIGGTELSNRWYRHRYPRRFSVPEAQQHNLSLVNYCTVR
jgi:transposase-like protein